MTIMREFAKDQRICYYAYVHLGVTIRIGVAIGFAAVIVVFILSIFHKYNHVFDSFQLIYSWLLLPIVVDIVFTLL